VMGKVMAQFKGKAEGGTINGIVREELAKRAWRWTFSRTQPGSATSIARPGFAISVPR